MITKLFIIALYSECQVPYSIYSSVPQRFCLGIWEDELKGAPLKEVEITVPFKGKGFNENLFANFVNNKISKLIQEKKPWRISFNGISSIENILIGNRSIREYEGNSESENFSFKNFTTILKQKFE